MSNPQRNNTYLILLLKQQYQQLHEVLIFSIFPVAKGFYVNLLVELLCRRKMRNSITYYACHQCTFLGGDCVPVISLNGGDAKIK